MKLELRLAAMAIGLASVVFFIASSFDDGGGFGNGGFSGDGGSFSLAGDAEGAINMVGNFLTFDADKDAGFLSDSDDLIKVSGILTDDGTGPLVLGGPTSCNLVTGDVCFGQDISADDNIISVGSISTFSGIQFTAGSFQGEVTYKEDNCIMLAPRPSNNRANNRVCLTNTVNSDKQHGPSVQTLAADPTFHFYSGTDPEVDSTQNGSISHDKTNLVIDTASGDISFTPATSLLRLSGIVCVSLPAAGTANRIGLVTDAAGGNGSLCFDNGSAWKLADGSGTNCCP